MSYISPFEDNKCTTCQWTIKDGYLIQPKVMQLRFKRSCGMYVYLVRTCRKLRKG